MVLGRSVFMLYGTAFLGSNFHSVSAPWDASRWQPHLAGIGDRQLNALCPGLPATLHCGPKIRQTNYALFRLNVLFFNVFLWFLWVLIIPKWLI